MRRHRIAIAILFVAALSWSQAPKRGITEKDIFQFVWIGQSEVSPDGSRVVFVKVTVNERRDNYDTQLYIMPTSGGEPVRLTAGIRDSSPTWSPDGKDLAFVRSPETEPDAGGSAQIYLLDMSGGEAQPLTRLPRGAGNPKWSPDGKHIAFVSSTTTEEFERAQRAASRLQNGEGAAGEAREPRNDEGEGPTSSFNPEHRSDVRVITRAEYRADGDGYLDLMHPSHIWVVDVPASLGEIPMPRQLTSGKFAENEHTWSKDGSLIYFTSNRIAEAYYELPTADLFSVSVKGGEPQKITTFNFGAHSLSLSPDGTKFALRGQRRVQPVQFTQPDLWVVDIQPGAQPKNLTLNLDLNVGSEEVGPSQDNETPRSEGDDHPIWTADGQNIIDVVVKEGRTNLFQFSANTGAATEYTRGDHAILNFTHAGHERLLLEISTPTQINDLYLFTSPGHGDRLTNVNQKLLSHLNLTEPEELTYTSFDGKKIQGWIQKPPDFDPGKKYPLILQIHGGPHTAYGWVFDHVAQLMTAKGYVVLYANPRGSAGYGQAFTNITQYNSPGDDFKDLMAGVDEVIKKGYIDQTKLGVTGGSSGGLLTDWVIGHTHRFAAAVSLRDIADQASEWYTTDSMELEPSDFRGAPFDQPEDFKTHSPITYIKNVTTPYMCILGEEDYRTPPGAGGEQMFRALEAMKRPAIMIRFPGEGHDLSRAGQPWHRVERLQHIGGWMDKYLMGKHIPQYDEVTGQEPPVPPEALRAQQPKNRLKQLSH